MIVYRGHHDGNRFLPPNCSSSCSRRLMIVSKALEGIFGASLTDAVVRAEKKERKRI